MQNSNEMLKVYKLVAVRSMEGVIRQLADFIVI